MRSTGEPGTGSNKHAKIYDRNNRVVDMHLYFGTHEHDDFRDLTKNNEKQINDHTKSRQKVFF